VFDREEEYLKKLAKKNEECHSFAMEIDRLKSKIECLQESERNLSEQHQQQMKMKQTEIDDFSIALSTEKDRIEDMKNELHDLRLNNERMAAESERLKYMANLVEELKMQRSTYGDNEMLHRNNKELTEEIKELHVKIHQQQIDQDALKLKIKSYEMREKSSEENKENFEKEIESLQTKVSVLNNAKNENIQTELAALKIAIEETERNVIQEQTMKNSIKERYEKQRTFYEQKLLEMTQKNIVQEQEIEQLIELTKKYDALEKRTNKSNITQTQVNEMSYYQKKHVDDLESIVNRGEADPFRRVHDSDLTRTELVEMLIELTRVSKELKEENATLKNAADELTLPTLPTTGREGEDYVQKLVDELKRRDEKKDTLNSRDESYCNLKYELLRDNLRGGSIDEVLERLTFELNKLNEKLINREIFIEEQQKQLEKISMTKSSVNTQEKVDESPTTCEDVSASFMNLTSDELVDWLEKLNVKGEKSQQNRVEVKDESQLVHFRERIILLSTANKSLKDENEHLRELIADGEEDALADNVMLRKKLQQAVKEKKVVEDALNKSYPCLVDGILRMSKQHEELLFTNTLLKENMIRKATDIVDENVKLKRKLDFLKRKLLRNMKAEELNESKPCSVASLCQARESSDDSNATYTISKKTEQESLEKINELSEKMKMIEANITQMHGTLKRSSKSNTSVDRFLDCLVNVRNLEKEKYELSHDTHYLDKDAQIQQIMHTIAVSDKERELLHSAINELKNDNSAYLEIKTRKLQLQIQNLKEEINSFEKPGKEVCSEIKELETQHQNLVTSIKRALHESVRSSVSSFISDIKKIEQKKLGAVREEKNSTVDMTECKIRVLERERQLLQSLVEKEVVSGEMKNCLVHYEKDLEEMNVEDVDDDMSVADEEWENMRINQEIKKILKLSQEIRAKVGEKDTLIESLRGFAEGNALKMIGEIIVLLNKRRYLRKEMERIKYMCSEDVSESYQSQKLEQSKRFIEKDINTLQELLKTIMSEQKEFSYISQVLQEQKFKIEQLQREITEEKKIHENFVTIRNKIRRGKQDCSYREENITTKGRKKHFDIPT
jgi:hypothetical protein